MHMYRQHKNFQSIFYSFNFFENTGKRIFENALNLFSEQILKNCFS